MARLSQIDPSLEPKLDVQDRCYYIGEYTAGGGFRASDTNQQIFNLKIKPSSPADRLYWKSGAITYWTRELARHLNLDAVAAGATIVPAPCSKPAGHPDYDDRILKVLLGLKAMQPGLDIRPILTTPVARQAQHEGDRLPIDELARSMSIDPPQLLVQPLKPQVIVVDDVFTKGGTFKAMQRLLLALPGVVQVSGIFLAKTVWPPLDYEAIFSDLN